MMKDQEKNYKLSEIVLGKVQSHRSFFYRIERFGKTYYERIPERGELPTQESSKIYGEEEINIYMSLQGLAQSYGVLPLFMDENMKLYDTVTRDNIDQLKICLENKRQLSDTQLKHIQTKSIEYARVINELLGINTLTKANPVIAKEGIQDVAVSALKEVKFTTTLSHLIMLELWGNDSISISNNGHIEDLSDIIKKALASAHIKTSGNLLENHFIFTADRTTYQYSKEKHKLLQL